MKRFLRILGIAVLSLTYSVLLRHQELASFVEEVQKRMFVDTTDSRPRAGAVCIVMFGSKVKSWETLLKLSCNRPLSILRVF